MAGTIEIAAGRRWSASTWLFDWVVEYLAKNVSVVKVQTQLQEIIDENIGWLGLSDFESDTRLEMSTLIRTRLVPQADAEFSAAMANRSGALDHLHRLVDQV